MCFQVDGFGGFGLKEDKSQINRIAEEVNMTRTKEDRRVYSFKESVLAGAAAAHSSDVLVGGVSGCLP